MRGSFLFISLTGFLLANGHYPFEICPGEEVIINLSLYNPKRTDDPPDGDMEDVYLQFWRKEGDWLLGGDQDIQVGTIPNGEERTVQIALSCDVNEPYEPNKDAWLWYRVMLRNGEVGPLPYVIFRAVLQEGPGPANLLSAEAVGAYEIYLSWEPTGNPGCCGGYYLDWVAEGGFDSGMEFVGDATSYTLQVPYPSTEYDLMLITANYDGEPTDLASNTLSVTTHPHLSARTRYSLNPSCGSKLAEHGDSVYLVHDDQGGVWLLVGKKAIGKVVWEEDEILFSDGIDFARDPSLVVGEDGTVYCAFAQDGKIYLTHYRPGQDLWPHTEEIYSAGLWGT